MTQGHRWVDAEPEIPFDYDVVYEDSGIIVIDKPHFLATTPRGMWYRQTALIRLRERFNEPDIVPAHRLDRATAGIVVFTRKPRLRKTYQMLFQRHMVAKTYECLAPAAPIARPRYGTIARLDPPAVFPLLRRSRIVKRRGILQAYEEPGEVNAETVVRLGNVDGCGAERSAYADRREAQSRWKEHAEDYAAACADVQAKPAGFHDSNYRAEGRSVVGRQSSDRGFRQRAANARSSRPTRCRRYILEPRTGKTHQLRVHMNALGLPITGDELYPSINYPDYDDFTAPLQLVARSLAFIDPITDEPRRFVSRVSLG
ncbi:pseudouridine synthase [Bifidobacterium subtile]|jgi:tRNA pseudouridine32 synthase/23S rRNA pseudouridine746 synthase|uniref:pseudouridine synthase n=1 Tax=Bifidobacterium subtile TaxID=77635 RepID=UPI002F34F365